MTVRSWVPGVHGSRTRSRRTVARRGSPGRCRHCGDRRPSPPSTTRRSSRDSIATASRSATRARFNLPRDRCEASNNEIRIVRERARDPTSANSDITCSRGGSSRAYVSSVTGAPPPTLPTMQQTGPGQTLDTPRRPRAAAAPPGGTHGATNRAYGPRNRDPGACAPASGPNHPRFVACRAAR